MVENGLLAEAIYAAMGQAFFTLSLGIGAMAIFGSYIRQRPLASWANPYQHLRVLDTFVALMAGLDYFPGMFRIRRKPGLRVPDLYSSLCRTCSTRCWADDSGAHLFFVFMTFAALSTIIAVFENIISFAMDLWGWSRKKAVAGKRNC